MEENNDRKKIADTLRAMIVEKMNLKEQDVLEDSSFTKDLGIDSLDQLELIMDVEKKFTIRIPDDEMERLKTFKDLVNFVLDKKI